MQTFDTKSIKKIELNVDNYEMHNHDIYPSQDLSQLTCFLKNAIFSKYISTDLIQKVEQIWILYEKRIDKFLKEKHLNISCNHVRPQVAINLEELARYQQKQIETYKRNIEILCSARNRLNDNDKYSVPVQATQHLPTNSSSVHVPKIPRCIDRTKVTNSYYNDDIDQLDDSKRNKIENQELSTLSMTSSQHKRRHCIFQHGEILPFDQNVNIRTIKMTYLCNNNSNK